MYIIEGRCVKNVYTISHRIINKQEKKTETNRKKKLTSQTTIRTIYFRL